MAPFSNLFSLVFLTTLLFLSLQIDARDSQFFSKVTHVNNNNNVKETELPNNEVPVNKPEQQPVFIPETENNYGLYGHEYGLKPPSTTTTNGAATTTTTYQPYKTESEVTSKLSNNNYYNKDSYSTNQDVVFDSRLAGNSYSSSNNNYFPTNNDAYGNKPNELSDTKYYTEGGYNSMEGQNNNNNNHKYYYNDNNNGANDKYFYNNYNDGANDKYFYNNNGANNKYYGERQGLSDTRFMEGGKYFYDVNSEKYNPTVYGDSARGVNPENWYNNRGYFGNNNNANSFENKNTMGGYQNHEVFEDEQEDFEP